jgi:hypothetical protein
MSPWFILFNNSIMLAGYNQLVLLIRHLTLLFWVSLRVELAERGSLPQSVEMYKIREIASVAQFILSAANVLPRLAKDARVNQ